MNNSKTLREIQDALGVSRRAVQGYEKAGLVSPTGRNKYGHLLYDEKAQERIAQIKLYQQMRFTVKEIQSLITAPDTVVKAALESQVLWLREEKRCIERMIEKADEWIRSIEV